MFHQLLNITKFSYSKDNLCAFMKQRNVLYRIKAPAKINKNNTHSITVNWFTHYFLSPMATSNIKITDLDEQYWALETTNDLTYLFYNLLSYFVIFRSLFSKKSQVLCFT